MFSSSLICLSLDLVDLNTQTHDEFPFNNKKLQQLLESMIELKQFHLYARLDQGPVDRNNILTKFKDQFWFENNILFGMHEQYFYTLPFHFDYLYKFYQGFNDVKSNNWDILINNPRLWYNVKSIDLPTISKYDFNFVQELKMKMPKLTFINFDLDYRYEMNKTEDIYVEKMDIAFDNVITFKCTEGSLERGKTWLIHTLPNLTHLILSSAELPPIDSQLTKILNKRIERLDIDLSSGLKLLTEINNIYFSNVQYINFYANDFWKRPHEYANIIMKMLNNFQNLKILLIYNDQMRKSYIRSDMETLLDAISKYLDMKNILKNYEMKNFRECLLFLKR
jgi:hypothetical protein